MLVLAPDPRLGIAPDRVSRVRAVLSAVTGGADGAPVEGGSDGIAAAAVPGVPGVVVVLPGGADGVLDALVLRPDGVLGFVPAPVRESVGAGGPLVQPGAAAPSTATDTLAAVELDRLLALTEPACAAPRRLLSSTAGSEGADEARIALTAPVTRTAAPGVLPDDVRRLLVAFRLADHVPDADELVRAGFLAQHPSHPPTPTGSSPAIPLPMIAPDTPGTGSRPVAAPVADAPVIPAARRGTSQGTGGTALDTGSGPAAPVTAPLPAVTATGGATPSTSTGGRSAVGRAGDPRPGLPATGRLSALAAPGRVPGPSRRGRTRLRDQVVDRLPDRLPTWATGYRGLALAAVAAFLVALGLALLAGRAVTGGGTADVAPVVTRVVDGVAFTRASVASDPTCDGHAYGQAAQFLRERPCVALDRALWTGTLEGRAVVVSVAVVRMADTTSAGALQSLVDTPGTGNVADLLREGRGYPGAPDRLTSAGYASTRVGDQAVFAESDRVSGSALDDGRLDALARTGLGLR